MANTPSDMEAEGLAAKGAVAAGDYLKAAEEGEPSAQCSLGMCYGNGYGVEQDWGKAVEWYRKAADQGHALAQKNLGVCYAKGLSVPQDFRMAVQWYEKSAVQGDSGALHNLGVCYAHGLAMSQDYPRAVRCYEEAAAQGHTAAQFYLGECLAKGLGVEADKARASQLFLQAANKGHPGAQHALGECCLKGLGMARSKTQAVEWFAKAAAQGHVAANYALGEACSRGVGGAADPIRAASHYKAAAAAGHPGALNALGQCYSKGSGVEVDLDKAADCYERAAEKGSASAQTSLGLCYASGLGKEQSWNQAVDLFRRAAAAGSSLAQKNLAVCCANGYGTERDLEAAVVWYTRAAEQGNSAAQANLGVCLANGLGCPQDSEGAAGWFRRAAAQGHAAAQHFLGDCLAKGIGVETDMPAAVEYYLKAGEQGHAGAQCALGVCYANGHAVPQDWSRAAMWYRKAAEQGNPIAQKNLGICYAKGHGLQQDFARAYEWYKRAADQGDAGAQTNLGVCYAHGLGVGRDEAAAAGWFERAAEAGHPPAQFLLGSAICNGQGVPVNRDKGVTWLSKAAVQGSAQAVSMLEELGVAFGTPQEVDSPRASPPSTPPPGAAPSPAEGGLVVPPSPLPGTLASAVKAGPVVAREPADPPTPPPAPEPVALKEVAVAAAAEEEEEQEETAPAATPEPAAPPEVPSVAPAAAAPVPSSPAPPSPGMAEATDSVLRVLSHMDHTIRDSLQKTEGSVTEATAHLRRLEGDFNGSHAKVAELSAKIEQVESVLDQTGDALLGARQDLLLKLQGHEQHITTVVGRVERSVAEGAAARGPSSSETSADDMLKYRSLEAEVAGIKAELAAAAQSLDRVPELTNAGRLTAGQLSMLEKLSMGNQQWLHRLETTVKEVRDKIATWSGEEVLIRITDLESRVEAVEQPAGGGEEGEVLVARVAGLEDRLSVSQEDTVGRVEEVTRRLLGLEGHMERATGLIETSVDLARSALAKAPAASPSPDARGLDSMERHLGSAAEALRASITSGAAMLAAGDPAAAARIDRLDADLASSTARIARLEEIAASRPVGSGEGGAAEGGGAGGVDPRLLPELVAVAAETAETAAREAGVRLDKLERAVFPGPDDAPVEGVEEAEGEGEEGAVAPPEPLAARVSRVDRVLDQTGDALVGMRQDLLLKLQGHEQHITAVVERVHYAVGGHTEKIAAMQEELGELKVSGVPAAGTSLSAAAGAAGASPGAEISEQMQEVTNARLGKLEESIAAARDALHQAMAGSRILMAGRAESDGRLERLEHEAKNRRPDRELAQHMSQLDTRVEGARAVIHGVSDKVEGLSGAQVALREKLSLLETQVAAATSMAHSVREASGEASAKAGSMSPRLATVEGQVADALEQLSSLVTLQQQTTSIGTSVLQLGGRVDGLVSGVARLRDTMAEETASNRSKAVAGAAEQRLAALEAALKRQQQERLDEVMAVSRKQSHGMERLVVEMAQRIAQLEKNLELEQESSLKALEAILSERGGESLLVQPDRANLGPSLPGGGSGSKHR